MKPERNDQGATAVQREMHGLPDFTGYTLIIDARSPHEYADDHVPGAVNLPVVNDEEFAEVGITYKDDPHAAYVVGAQYALKNIADYIGNVIRSHPSDSRFLVYCYRGGKRSRAWAEPLRGIGYQTDVLPGGWKAYRRSVLAGLAKLPLQFEFRVVAGKTGCGKTRLLQELQRVGQQVLDLEHLAAHKGSLLGLFPGQTQPTQKLFDSELLATLRYLDPGRPVWVEAESKKVGNVQLPDALVEAMNRSPRVEISAPLPERVKLLREEYAHLAREPELVLERLAPLKPLVGKKELDVWAGLVADGNVDELIARLLQAHYDPSYSRSFQRNRTAEQQVVDIEVESLGDDELARAAAMLGAHFGHRPWNPDSFSS